MIVTPHREDPFLRLRSFDDFFAAVQQSLRDRLDEQPCLDSRSVRATDVGIHAGKSGSVGSTAIAQVAQIVSLSVPLYGIDPLRALDAISTKEQEYFYWENGRREEAITAVGSVAGIHVTGSDRIAQAKQFIRQCFAQTLTIGDIDCPFAGARFFCRFTFFDEAAPAADADLSQRKIQYAERLNRDVAPFSASEFLAPKSLDLPFRF